MTAPGFGALARIALSRHGVFARTEARSCGYSDYLIRRNVNSGEWLALQDSAFVVASQPVGPSQRAAAAVVSVAGSAVSHMSALALEGLTSWPHLTHVTAPHGQRRRLPGVVVHQSRVMVAEDVRLLHGLPTTTTERTLIDCGTQASAVLLTVSIDEALRLGRTDVERLAQRSLDLRPDGRFGGAAVRRVLAERPPREDRHDSVLESLVARLLHAGGLGHYMHHHVVALAGRNAELDFAFLPERVNVETDGSGHDREDQRRWDARRDAALRRLGWVVRRFRWADVVEHPASVLRTVRRDLAAAGRRLEAQG